MNAIAIEFEASSHDQSAVHEDPLPTAFLTLASLRRSRQTSAMTPRMLRTHELLCGLYDWLGRSGRPMHVLAKLIKYGPQGAANYGPTVPPDMPTELQHVLDAVVARNERERTAISITYGGGAGDGAPIEVLSRTLHCSHSVARRAVKEARKGIASFIEGRGVHLPRE